MRLSCVVSACLVVSAMASGEELATVSVRFDTGFPDAVLRVEAPENASAQMKAMKAFPAVPPGASLVVTDRGVAGQRVGVWYQDCNVESRDMDGKAGCVYLVPRGEAIAFRVSGDREKLRQFRAELQSGDAKAVPLTLGELEPDATIKIELSAEQIAAKGDNRLVILAVPSLLKDEAKTTVATEAAPADGPTAPSL